MLWPRERSLVMYPPLLLSLLRRADQVLFLVLTVPQYVFSQSESPSEPPSRCEVESSVFTTPGDVSRVAEYDVGKLLDLHVGLKQLSLKYNCLLKMEPSSNPSS